MIYDKLPGGNDHTAGSISIKDDKLYFPIGAPCNICDPGEYAKIYRMNLDGSNVETLAAGVRNTVGFDFDPKTGDLWFTDNGRDWFSEELPNDELNRLDMKKLGQHFGYPFCHQGNVPDPEFGWGKSCDDFVKPAALLGPHASSRPPDSTTARCFRRNTKARCSSRSTRAVEHQNYNGVYASPGPTARVARGGTRS